MINHRPVYALCTSKLHMPNVLESASAFIKEAESRGYAVMVFNASLESGKVHQANCSSVFQLIPFAAVDLIVCMPDAINDEAVLQSIMEQAKVHRIPVMAYDGVIDGVSSVCSQNQTAAASLMTHVFQKHGCHRVNLLTGSRGDYCSEKLVMSYRSILQQYHIDFEDERVGYGSDSEAAVQAAVRQFLKYDTPEAILCGDNAAAYSVCSVLRRNGLRVPEDIIVIGLQGAAAEQYCSPDLTSCQVDVRQMGSAAVDMAELIADGGNADDCVEIQPLLHISESCGCCATEQKDQSDIVFALHRKVQMLMEQESSVYGFLEPIMHQKQPTAIDFQNAFAGYLPKRSCLCLRDNLSPDLKPEKLMQFSDENELMSVLTNNGKERQFSIVQRAKLIPDLENILDAGNTIFVNAVFLQNEIYGYYVYYGNQLEEEFFRLPGFLHTISAVMATSLITTRLRNLNEKLVAARIRDPLTGMLNIQGILKVLSDRLQAEKHDGERLIVVVIGLNRLHQINSIFGREEGDQALLSLAGAINDSIDSDAVSGRVGGDEFLIAFFSSTVRMNTAEALISVLKKRLMSYNQVSGKSYSLDISIGKVQGTINGHIGLESLIQEAVAAKDAQKKDQGASAAQPIQEQNAERIDQILKKNQLVYHFQPIVNSKNGQIYAYEALMRTSGEPRISPLAILNYASATNRLYEIEYLTYFNVLQYIRNHYAIFEGKRVFINSIPGHFLTESDYQQICSEYGDILSKLVVEFTEQAETEGEELTMVQRRCMENHMEIAVDDYGTGYSNISNLLRYSPNYVKIDRSLISNIQEEPKKQHFVVNIIDFAHANGFMALAEGVETMEEMRAVIRFGVDLIQGNFTSLPASAPVSEIESRTAAQIAKFSATASKQAIRKTYILSGEASVSLPQLDAEHYTDLFVSQPSLEIVGDFNQTSGIRIKIKDDNDCVITLYNVHLGSAQQTSLPAIILGRNSKVTLKFQGDNRMDAGGIQVPESSTLQLTGNGNLSIRVDDTKSYAIGNDSDFAAGNIYIDLSGCLNIISNGSDCIGIGCGIGKNKIISITGTKLFFEMSGKHGVGIGVMDGETDISLAGCSLNFNTRIASSVSIGSGEGTPRILCNTVCAAFHNSGNEIFCIGSSAGGGELTLRDSNVAAELMGQKILVVGSGNDAPNISLRQCDINIQAEGTSALDLGSYTDDAKLALIDTNAEITIKSANAKHFAAVPGERIISGGIHKVNINE
ncbi:MAG: EAL domain-containing protein [Oscillospiraceae bacterium]|nr:EAL domain-containing protein [Oscillospiraceae bacterium]